VSSPASASGCRADSQPALSAGTGPGTTVIRMETTLQRPVDYLAGPARPTRWAPLVRGRAEDPGWVRPSLLGLLAATALLYLWALVKAGL
jgi:hypothetical protein